MPLHVPGLALITRMRHLYTIVKNYDVIKYFLFPTTGKYVRLYSGVCLSWYASKLEHGTSCTVVRNKNNNQVYYLGLSEEAPVTTVAWGESKPKNKEYLN